ncbi:hypothetical protein Tco_0617003, partial [Tanacetum coccineum]
MRSYSLACFSKWHHLPSCSSRIQHLLHLAVEESGLDEPELGNPGLDEPMLDKLEA